MALIRLYKVDPKISEENNTLMSFERGSVRNNFFNSLPIKETVDHELSVNWKKQIFDLETTLTLYNDGRRPLQEYNYLNINQDSFNHYYFITGYEEKGANQLMYYLRKDTLNTYCSNPVYGVDIENSEGLVLREHKDRFVLSNGVMKPKTNDSIESVNLTPKYTNFIKNIDNTMSRSKLVMRAFGGDTESDGHVTSRIRYFWEYYSNSNVKKSQSIKNFKLSDGWGVGENKSLSASSTSFEVIIGNAKFIIRNASTTWKDEYYVYQRGNYKGENGHLRKYNSATRQWKDISADVTIVESSEYVKVQALEISFPEGYVPIVKLENQHLIKYGFGTGRTSFLPYESRLQLFSSYYNIEPNDLDMIDTTTNINMKIVELPYELVLNHNYEGNIFTNNAGSILFEVLESLTFDNFQVTNYSFNNPTFSMSGGDYYQIMGNDPKLYNSQFEPLFFTWFNESMLIKRENFSVLENIISYMINVDLDTESYQKMRFDIKMGGNYKTNEINEMTRFIDMNNNVAVIGSNLDHYLDYLKTNDLKLMELQQAQATRNLQKQEVNLLTSAAIGAGSGMLMGSLPGAAVGAAGGLITGGLNLSHSRMMFELDKSTREIDYKNKMVSLQNGMINISGGSIEMLRNDDLDRLKLYKISLSDSDYYYLDNYFHKYGYETLEYKKIIKQTRRYFDYKKIHFNELTCNINLTLDVKNDIATRFAEGVTIYHRYNNRFDFAQEYENWEVTI